MDKICVPPEAKEIQQVTQVANKNTKKETKDEEIMWESYIEQDI